MIKDLSERVKEALGKAKGLARELGDSCSSTGHLIFGLTADHLSLGNRIFDDINIYPEMFRDHLKKLPRETVEPDENGLNELGRLALTRGREAKKKLGGGREIQTDHLLLALLSIREGSAFECLREFSVEPREIMIELVEAMGFEFRDCPVWKS